VQAREFEGVHEVIDVEQVAHLLAVP